MFPPGQLMVDLALAEDGEAAAAGEGEESESICYGETLFSPRYGPAEEPPDYDRLFESALEQRQD